MLFLQILLYCLLFLLMVKLLARDSGRNCLYFYPQSYLEEAQKRGLIADKDAILKKGKLCMIPFCLILVVVLVLILSLWNHVADFKTAYWQAYLFLLVMNWFDGVVLDRLWVAHGKLWRIEGMEGVPYIKPWKTVLIKRGLATVLYLA
ncbi:hypothetical protein, partial [uncultured Gemmiger sp.]|uniref:hypothetical protein n=1 Tax=uncultured Gemmiger sp. TaxID=1623490 RepID=UPI0025E7387B